MQASAFRRLTPMFSANNGRKTLENLDQACETLGLDATVFFYK
ncbi:hypothetical protein FM102_05695 [Corynebacterium glutamicum]|nr:hypothetical protein FM102_05695 [Corynebacterium glutamicum]